MLTPNQIISYANSTTITKNALTEYYQHELLDSLFKQKNSQYFSFIGGTAIRIVHGGQRFSEDLDFDTTKIAAFDQVLTDTITDLTTKGFVVESRLIHKGAYHCHLRFPHVLKALGLSGYAEEKLLIKVDATSFDTLYTEPFILNKYGVFQTIKAAPADVLLSKKLLTIMSRKRPKGRDLYDVTYLWGMTSPNREYIETIGKTNLTQLVGELVNFSQNLDLKPMSREISPFLVNPQDMERVEKFADFITSKIKN